jgi:UDP-2-acetamido-3-amino-2,3-dideoxy-glucuronate N-acetyltransferase
LIGAGAVVIKSVKDYSIVVGNPARHVGWACECGVKLSSSLSCEQCKREYELREDSLYEK